MMPLRNCLIPDFSSSCGMHGGFAFEFTPAHQPAPQGIQGGLHGYVIHQLAIEETLPEQKDEQQPVFMVFQGEGKDGGQIVNRHEQGVVKQHAIQSVRGKVHRVMP